jgi:2-polyprenyl-3-methyl-5-hydroxy-6-metoxy-1,4-benzoquinol methylase
MFIILRFFSHKRLFTYYYHKNIWGSKSRSGPGSELVQTQTIINSLPLLISKYSIKSILDIPCGDRSWISKVDLTDVRYLGVDIVKDIISNNINEFSNHNTSFTQGNILTFNLQNFDLIICRDLFIHFSNSTVLECLNRIKESNSTYLLTTQFSNRTINLDIKTGSFRPINLSIAPFYLPNPLYTLNENCTEANGLYSDKSLALWKISEI